jgi:transcriptional regulator with XRE-family HTH domain
MDAVRNLRESANVTQSELAEAGGTSQPTIAAYEAGRKSPTLRTLERLARATGRDVVVSFVPTLTREDRRSLFLHRAIAGILRDSPAKTISHANRNLDRMLERHPDARLLLEEWAEILERSIDAIVDVVVDPRVHARDLRQVTPFAGVLTGTERARVYAAFVKSEEGA